MRRLCVPCLFVLMVLLPAVDSVYCADGCADAGRTRCAWQTDVSAAADGCGLCLNGLAVSSPPPPIVPTRRIQPAPAPRISGLIPSIPRPIDQPPRRS
ncbi:MAG TPA: hypothetical protein VGP77_06755 [Vicinamibacterales bacterium]|nr:hypothetical protein [Vicinamibacterales bacterium]